MQQLTTVYRKYVTKMTNLSNPPLLEMWEIALPTPLRIDAPVYSAPSRVILQNVMHFEASGFDASAHSVGLWLHCELFLGLIVIKLKIVLVVGLVRTSIL